MCAQTVSILWHACSCYSYWHSEQHVKSCALKSVAVGKQVIRSQVVRITTVVATMMYDSSILSSPRNMANACILFLHRIYPLTMLPQSGIVTTVDSVDEVRY